MFGCWRKVDAADPETFITAVAAVLADYPESVVLYVTDPRTGLPGKQQFPPSPYEVKQACEAEMAPIVRQREREARYVQTERLLAAPQGRRPSEAELREKYGPNWGIRAPTETQKRKAMTPAQAKEALRALSPLSDEEFEAQWEKTPDQPTSSRTIGEAA